MYKKKFFSYIAKEKKDFSECEAELYNDYEIGLITSAEMCKELGKLGFAAFLSAKIRFKKDFGYTPVKVPFYGFYDIDIYDFEKAKLVA